MEQDLNQNLTNETIEDMNAVPGTDTCIPAKPIEDSNDGESNEMITPQASRFAIAILFLLPLLFIPFYRQTFPHIGLWPAFIVACLSIYLGSHPVYPWDKKIAKIGFCLSSLSFLVFIPTIISNRIPGPAPDFALSFEQIEFSWPVKILQFIVLIIAVIFHESAHGISAYLSGDPTAKNAGRISLNPLRHVDLFGTVILPIILMSIPGSAVFGWAKPVPVKYSNFRSQKKGRFAVSIAGVATNFFLFLFCTALLMSVGVLLHLNYPSMSTKGFFILWQEVSITGIPYVFVWKLVIEALKAGIIINLILFTLNILPVPPLDGYGILESIVPDGLRRWLEMGRGLGSLVFITLIFFRILDYIFIPAYVLAALFAYMAGLVAKLG